MSDMEVASLTQTCPRNPSQWEGTLSDGRTLYIRYRHDWLNIYVSKVPGGDAVDEIEILNAHLGRGQEYEMSEAEVRSWLAQLKVP